jgi:hypothetical protein
MSFIAPRATISAMHSPFPPQAKVAALALAFTLAFSSSGCSSSATANLTPAKQAPPAIEFLGAWGTKGSGPGLLADPRAIAADAFGEVYITDAGSSERFIHKFSRDGHALLSFEPLAPIHNPCASAVDLGGAIYSLECGPGALYVFKPEGDLLRTIRGGMAAPSKPSSVTVDNEGRIYVAESHAKRILRYTPRGSVLGAWGGKASGPGALRVTQETSTLHADQIAATLNGNLFLLDSDRAWFAHVTTSGIIMKEWTMAATGARDCHLAVTKSSVVALCGPPSAPVVHVFSYDGDEKFSKPLLNLDPSLTGITFAGIAAMQDGEIFILDSAAPRVLHLRVNQ